MLSSLTLVEVILQTENATCFQHRKPILSSTFRDWGVLVVHATYIHTFRDISAVFFAAIQERRRMPDKSSSLGHFFFLRILESELTVNFYWPVQNNNNELENHEQEFFE